MGEDFATQLFVKTNVAEVLESEVRRKGWTRQTVAIGTATDPYQPIEGKYRLTRRCLEVLAANGTPANVTTKGTLVVRDIDVLQELGRRAGAGVSISLISLDDQVWRHLEPGTAPPRQRLRALQRLADAGVPCGLALAPVLPGITDAPQALEAVVAAAVEHGAQWLWSGTVHLEPAIRDWFLGAVGRHFPHVMPSYERVFGRVGGATRVTYTPKAYAASVGRRVAELKERYGLGERRRAAPVTESSLPEVGETVERSRAGTESTEAFGLLDVRAGRPVHLDSDAPRQMALPL